MSESDLQYPIGRPPSPQSLSPAEREAALVILTELPAQLSAAVEGLTEGQLDTPYRPGGWTLRQVVHHVADSHINAYSRTRLAITEDWPNIYAYHQAAWAELADSRLPVDISLRLLESLHRRWVTTLQGLPESAWTRGYHHPENGRQELSAVLAMYAWHSRHHLAHVVDCRRRNGW